MSKTHWAESISERPTNRKKYQWQTVCVRVSSGGNDQVTMTKTEHQNQIIEEFLMTHVMTHLSLFCRRRRHLAGIPDAAQHPKGIQPEPSGLLHRHGRVAGAQRAAQRRLPGGLRPGRL